MSVVVMLFQEHLFAPGKVFHRQVVLSAVPRKGEFVTLNFRDGGQEVIQVEHVVGESFARVMLEHTQKPWCTTSDMTIEEMAKDGWDSDTIIQQKDEPCSESEPRSY